MTFYLRLPTIALITLLGFGAKAGADTPTNFTIATPPDRPGLEGPQRFGTNPPVQSATLDLVCGNTIFRLDTGTDGGECSLSIVDGVPQVSCTDGTGFLAEANCADGCTVVNDTGSCTVNPQ